MNIDGLKAYRNTERLTASGCENEARVLIEGATKLRQCQDCWDCANRRTRLLAALKYNQQIWSIFQAELAREDNPLPKETRLNLLRLSLFIDRQIFQAMAFPAPEKLDPIIRINLSIAQGLKKKKAIGAIMQPKLKANRSVRHSV